MLSLIFAHDFRKCIARSGLAIVVSMMLLCSGAMTTRAAETAGTTNDCQPATAVNPGLSRVYIAVRNGQDGSGKSADDARDGSSPEKFDRTLRCYSEGCADPSAPQKSVSKTENLIVCLGPGTFRTDGSYDYVINVPHSSHRGFALGKGWKVHGSGADKTTVQLSSYLPARAVPNPHNVPVGTATGVVFSTSSDDASDIEVSDLTIDDNYPELKSRATKEAIKALNLEAIQLRSDRGHNWIHDINVLHTSGEIGTIDEKWETFPVWIYSAKQGSPQDSSANVIERVNMTSYGGGQCTAIAVANAVAEVRNNKVDGYQIGYGGWALGPANFHDNIAVGTEYGFNIDSLVNRGVVIERNLILHPRKYGIVIGGSATYAGFVIKDNTIQIDQPGVIGMVFQGNVTGALVEGNSFLWRGQSSFGSFFSSSPIAIRNYSAHSAGVNQKNSYQNNKISSNLKVTFNGPSRKSDSCFFQNHDESGKPAGSLPDSNKTGCTANAGSAR
jgi:hypothetical protein